MNITAEEIASFVGGEVSGDAGTHVTGIAKIDEAVKGDLTFLYLPAYEKYFSSTKASVILVKNEFKKSRNDITYIEVSDPNKAFYKIIEKYFSDVHKLTGIDPASFIHQGAVLGENVSIGRNVVISDGCRIGSNVKIFHNTVLLENVEIGDDCLIYQNVSLREGCKIGNRVIIHSGTVIGSDGFGYYTDDAGVYHKIPQIGNVIIEDDVEIGANVTVDRAALGSTIIKRGVKIDNLVQIAHNVVVGEHTVISSQTGISGSTRIGNHCILAGQVGIVGHIEITDNVILMAQSGISKSITKPGQYFGSPAKELKTSLKLEAHIRNLPSYLEKIKRLEDEIKQLKEQINKSSDKK